MYFFYELQKNKFSHSKLETVEHNSQLIFQLRGRVTEVKMNDRGNYDKLECRACALEEEPNITFYYVKN